MTKYIEERETGFLSRVVKGFVLCAALSVLTGIVYPYAVTGAARMIFPTQSHGSLVRADRDGVERVVGSRLIGQSFEGTPYFKGRPNSTINPSVSGGTNRGPLSPELLSGTTARIESWKALKGSDEEVPLDLVTASASGQDPHISRAAARYQISIVSRETGVPEEVLSDLVKKFDENGLFGRHHFVNVLELNLALIDVMKTSVPSVVTATN